jgi:predicted amidohydrolase YtcJ
LDTVAAGRRLFVIHDSGHACAVNTAVLELLPSSIRHDDGVLTESGMAAVRVLRMPYSIAELVEAIEVAGRTCLREGVTAVAEAGLGGGLVRHSPVELAAYQRALDEGRLPIRVQAMIAADALRPTETHPADGITRAVDLGLRTGLGGDRLSIGALKVFTDGGMMARTAALTEPYVGGAEGSGELYAEPDLLRAQIVEGHRAGWQLAIHAIGDRAVDVALDAVQQAQRECPRSDARHRIEHAGLVRPDQLARFAELDLTAVVQPSFLYWSGDDYAAIMGEHRAPWLYRGRGFLDQGIRLAGSSDRPVTVGAPLQAIQFMVERTSRTGLVIGPDEAISVEAALHAYTAEAARACHWENSLGSLTAGKLADLTVLAEDPRQVDPSRISAIKILATLVGGAVVHGAFPADPGWPTR